MTVTEFRRRPNLDVDWDPLEHPRDSRGRFIETGANVQVSSGLRGRVIEIRPDRQRNITAIHIQLTDGRKGWERADRMIVLDPDKNEIKKPKPQSTPKKATPTPKQPAAKTPATPKVPSGKTAEEWRDNLKSMRTTGTPRERLRKSFPHIYDEQIHWGDASEDQKHAIINGMEDVANLVPALKRRNMVQGIDIRDDLPRGLENAMGGFDMSMFRKFYLNNARINEFDDVHKRSTEQGFWANYGDAESGLYAVTVHEMGHAAHAAISPLDSRGYPHGYTARDILNSASEKGGYLKSKDEDRTLSQKQVQVQLGTYAASNDLETIAESFAESVIQGPAARPLARDVVNSVIEKFDGEGARVPDVTPEGQSKIDAYKRDRELYERAASIAMRAREGPLSTKYVPTMEDDQLDRELEAANRAVDLPFASEERYEQVRAYRDALDAERRSRGTPVSQPDPEPTPEPERTSTPEPPSNAETETSAERPNNTDGWEVDDLISANGFEGKVISVRPNRKDASVPPVLIYEEADGTRHSVKANKATKTGKADSSKPTPESAPNPVAPEKPQPAGDVDRAKTPFVKGDRVSANGREGTITSVRGGGPDDKRSLVIFQEDDGTYRTARFSKATRIETAEDSSNESDAPESTPTPEPTPEPELDIDPDDKDTDDGLNDPDSDHTYEPLIKARQELIDARKAGNTTSGQSKRKYVEVSERIAEAKRKVAEEERRSKLSERDRLAEDVDRSEKNIEKLRDMEVPPNIMAEIERKHRENKDRLDKMDGNGSSEDDSNDAPGVATSNIPDAPYEPNPEFDNSDIDSEGSLWGYKQFESWDINGPLRGTGGDFEGQELDEKIFGIDRAMTPTENDQTFYRNVQTDSIFNDMKSGERFVDFGFTSTTRQEGGVPNPDGSNQYGNLYMEIEVPKGTHMFDFADIEEQQRQEDPGFEDEPFIPDREVILDRGTEFEVVSNENGKIKLRVASTRRGRATEGRTVSDATGIGNTETRKATNWEQS